MKIEQVMQQDVRTIAPERSIVDAARHMRSFGIGCLVVVDDGKVKGIITDRDVVIRAVTHGHDVNRSTVGQNMTSPVITIPRDTDLLDAARLMAEKGVRRLPVVDGERLVGLVSYSDIARAIDQSLRDVIVGQAKRAAPIDLEPKRQSANLNRPGPVPGGARTSYSRDRPRPEGRPPRRGISPLPE